MVVLSKDDNKRAIEAKRKEQAWKAEGEAQARKDRNEARQFHRWLLKVKLSAECVRIVTEIGQEHPYLLEPEEQAPKPLARSSNGSWPI